MDNWKRVGWHWSPVTVPQVAVFHAGRLTRLLESGSSDNAINDKECFRYFDEFVGMNRNMIHLFCFLNFQRKPRVHLYLIFGKKNHVSSLFIFSPTYRRRPGSFVRDWRFRRFVRRVFCRRDRRRFRFSWRLPDKRRRDPCFRRRRGLWHWRCL